MGRAGGGRSGGGRSSGGRSSSRSSGGHRSYSSSRAGSGSRSSFRSSNRYHGTSYSRTHYGPSFVNVGGGTNKGCLASVFSTFAGLFAVLFIIICLFALVGKQSEPKTTVIREKLTGSRSYIHDCIVDELGWFDYESNTETRLKYFWDKTGVQPYIYLKAYDPLLVTDQEKEAWANDWYGKNFKREDIFLFVYFAERNQDEDVGYMCYVNGYQTNLVMDPEAIDIFWKYVDRDWYSDKSTDQVFIDVYKNTADKIMEVPVNESNVAKWVIIFFIVAVTGFVVIKLVKMKVKRDKEEAEETRKILETPVEKLGNQSDDDLLNKWSNDDSAS